MDASTVKVRDVMSTELVTVGPDTTLSEAIQVLRQHRIRGVPVVEDGRLLGMITDRDLRMMLGPGAKSGDEGLLDGLPDASVRSVMSLHAQTVRPDEPLHVAARLLADLRIGALPVVDDTQALVGIVSVSDVLAIAADVLEQIARG